jgi:phospholipid-binding lipoprotein MlaA
LVPAGEFWYSAPQFIVTQTELIHRLALIRVLLLGLLLATAQGCAALSDSLPNTSTDLTTPPAGLASTDVSASVAPVIETTVPVEAPVSADASEALPVSVPAQESQPEPIVVAADQPPAAPAAPDKKEKDTDEFYDPFAKKGEAADAADADPWEGFNSAMFEFNRKFDKYVLKPVAKVYDKVMPNALQKGISNFYYNNIHFGPRFINNLLQFKLKGAGTELGRLVINDVIGLAGFFDPATHWLGIDKPPQEDTGQTLGAYGVPPGPYLVLPLLPPFTLRDFFGYLLDFGANPVNYFLLPTFEVDNWPSAIPHKNRDTTTILQLGRTVEDLVNYRSLNLETFEGVEEATVDLYSAVRNAYLQKRAKAIRE